MDDQALNVKKILPFTSLLFLVPSVYAYGSNHYIPCSILFLLANSSVLYHSSYHPIAYWIDQVTIYTTIVSSFVYGYLGGFHVFLIPTAGNLWNTYVYWYGYKTKTMVFHPDLAIANLWHSTIHIVSSLSYLAILMSISQPLEL